MKESEVETASLKMSRVIKAPPEHVYNAFLDAEVYAKWLPPAGYTAKVFHLDPREGGTYRARFSSLDKSDVHTFGGTYRELTPYERIVHTDAFETRDSTLQGEMRVTITFKEVAGGTEVAVLQEGIPKAIPLDDARAGWTSSLENLARLVEMPA